MNASAEYLLTLFAHHLWRCGIKIKQTFRASVLDRVRYGSSAESAPRNTDLILCNYRWVDGRQYTFIQPQRNDRKNLELFCAVAVTNEGLEIDVSEAVASLFGPHLDFHGAELTVRDILDCVDLSPDTIDCFLISIKADHTFHDKEFSRVEYDNIIDLDHHIQNTSK